MDILSRLSNELDIWITGRLSMLLGSLALLYVCYKMSGHQSALAFTVYFVFMAVYLTVMWVPRVSWDVVTFAVATVSLCAVATYFHYAARLDTAALLWPMVAVLARLPQAKAIQSAALAVVCICVILVLSGVSVFPWGELFGLCGVYAMVRGRQIRREAKRLSELHLQELNEAHQALRRAHAELEEATVQAIRYAALAERSRIARDVHDVMGHNLTTLIVQLQALRHVLPSDPQTASTLIPQMLDVARTGMDEIREAVREWAEDDTGLGIVALRGLVSRVETETDLRINFMADEDLGEWPLDISIVLYRVLQECLTNILRYADAEYACIHICRQDNCVLMTVSDDGIYTGQPPIQPGFGMNSMLERCTSVGGTCTFEVNSPHGLAVNVKVPVQIESADAYDGGRDDG